MREIRTWVQRLLSSSTAQATAIRMVATGAGVVAGILMARLAGAETKGQFSSVVAIANLVFAAINLEIGPELVRRGRQESSQASTFRWVVPFWLWYLGVGILVSAVLWPISRFAAGVVVASIAVTCYTQASILLNGRFGPRAAAVQVLVQQVALTLSTVVYYFLGILTARLVFSLVALSMLAGLGYAVIRAVTARGSTFPLEERKFSIVLGGLPWVPNRLGQMALQRIDLVIVFFLLGAGPAGVYSVAVSIGALMQILPMQYGLSAQHLAANKVDHSLRSLVLKTLGFGVVSAVIVAGLGHFLIVVMYGDEFAGAYPLLLALLPAIVVFPAYQTVCNSFRMTRGHHMATYSALLGVVSLLLAAMVAPWGSGAGRIAVASSIGSAVAFVSIVVMARMSGARG